MTISLKHSKTSTVPDSGDTTLVQPSDWNSEHTLSCATGKIIGRSTAGVGNAEEITIGAGLSLSGGELSATDAGGTVTSVSVVTANGLAGSVANQTTTPAITLSTTVTGLLKGNGTAISAASSGTDYAPATSGTAILKGNGAGGFANASAGTDYVSPSVLGAANGVATLGSDSKLTSSQIPDISIVTYLGVVASQSAMLALTGQQGDWCTRSDLGTNWIITGANPALLASWTQLSYPTAPVTSVNTQTGAVVLSAANVGAQPAITVNGIIKGNGSGTLSAATSGTDYAPATSGTAILKGNGSGGFSSATAGTDYSAGTSSLATGIVKSTTSTGALSIAVSGTDYAPATSGTSILYGNGSGGFSNVTVGSGLSFAGGTISNSSAMTYPGAGMAVSTGSAWGTSKTAPTGDVVGTSDTQTLTNKTLTAAGSNTVEATSGPTSSQLAGNRNKIINGAMMIDQRNAGAAVTPTTGGTYTLDRWRAGLTQSSKYSIQQNAGSVTPPEGFVKYLGITSLSAYSVLTTDAFAILQIVEGFNIADLGWGTANAKNVVLSFWVRSSLTGTFGGSLRNENTDRSYPFTYVISSANTWEQKTLSITGDTTGTWLTNNSGGIYVSLGLGCGSTFNGTAGAWSAGNFISTTGATSVVGTNGATFYITGVQLEKGATATPFENRLYGTELALCQRYYEVVTGSFRAYTSDGYIGVTTSFKVTKRASPTTTYIAGGNQNSGTLQEFVTGFYSGMDLNACFPQWRPVAAGTYYNYGYCITASSEL